MPRGTFGRAAAETKNVSPLVHHHSSASTLTHALYIYKANPTTGNFCQLKKLLVNDLSKSLEALVLPLSGPWSAQVLGKIHCPSRQRNNATVLQGFCKNANLIAELVSRAVPDPDQCKRILGLIEEFFVDFVNAKDNFAAAEDGEQDFVVLAGYARSPAYMSYINGDIENFPGEIFAPAEAKPASKQVLAVLNEIFSPLSLRLDLRPWHYLVFENFGEEDFSEGFVYNSAMPFINKMAQQESREIYADRYVADELIAHEMSHAVLRELGYEESVDPSDKSYISKMSKSQVHEMIAFAAGIQFAPLPVLFNLLSNSDPDYLRRVGPIRDLFFDSCEKFLTKLGFSLAQVIARDEGISIVSGQSFADFVKSFEQILGEQGLARLESFIKKRFMSEAQKLVKQLGLNGAFDEDLVHALKNHLVIS